MCIFPLCICNALRVLILGFLKEDFNIKNKLHNSVCEAEINSITAELLMKHSSCKKVGKHKN